MRELARVAAAGLFAVLLLICACGLSVAPVTAVGDGAANYIDLTNTLGNDSIAGDAVRGTADINGDGKVDIYDAGYLMNVIRNAGNIVSRIDDETVQQNLFRCDLKQDGLVTEKDMIWPETEDVVLTDFEITRENRSMIGYMGQENEELHIPEKFRAEDDTWYRVTAIGANAFSVITYEDGEFTGGPVGVSPVGDVAIPNSVTRIDTAAFSYCTKITGLVLPDNIEFIGDYAFFSVLGCEGIWLYPEVAILSVLMDSNVAVLTESWLCPTVLEFWGTRHLPIVKTLRGT